MAKSDYLLSHFREALAAISSPRFYETERGFQGELLSQIGRRIQMSEQMILEQEYQKRQGSHGLSIRPDVIIHEPFEFTNYQNRRQGNYAVVELKLDANENDAKSDFDKLALMIEVLEYPLGIFVNINSNKTFIDKAPKRLNGKLFSFAVELRDSKVQVVEARI